MIASFDVSIDIPHHLADLYMAPQDAVKRVRKAVEAMSGAGWVSVQWGGRLPDGLPWARTYEPGCSLPQMGGAWLGLAGLIEVVARQAARG